LSRNCLILLQKSEIRNSILSENNGNLGIESYRYFRILYKRHKTNVRKRGMVVIKVADFGGFIDCVVDGDRITIDKNITCEGIKQVNKIVRYSQMKQDMALVDAREEYLCAGSVR